jgi:integrase
MTERRKVKYLKIDRGRYFYQRRVPLRLQAHLGFRRWQIPCGDVSYSKAVQMIVTWAEEHDQLIADMREPDRLREAGIASVRAKRQQRESEPDPLGLPRFYEMTERRAGEKQYFTRDRLPRPWQASAKMMEEAQEANEGTLPLDDYKKSIAYRLEEVKRGDEIDMAMSLPNVPGLREYVESLYPELVSAGRIHVRTAPLMPYYPELYLDSLKSAYDIGFGPDRRPPTNPDEKDEYEFIKRKLERKISELSPDPNTLSSVLETYCDFNSIRPRTRAKYKRELARLIKITGDVPIGHIRAEDLRGLRDSLLGDLKPASIHAVFTPLKGMFNHAFEEAIIESNPMAGVKLPRDRRPIEERKWKKFEPEEVRRILSAVDAVWGSPTRGLSDARRAGCRMVVRTLAFTGMRPIEVLRLTPEDVSDKLIRVRGSKTESSTRVVPLHHELEDLPSWIADGGLATFENIGSDPVSSVRHNFERLIRETMAPPISDPQKVLYSFRSSFVNAMRRAGADIQVRRAILGHKEAGAIRHYDDGPEFDIKDRWVQATDPRASPVSHLADDQEDDL